MGGLRRREKPPSKEDAVKIAQFGVCQGIMLEGTDGWLEKVKDSEAQMLLRRAIVRGLRSSAEPIVMRLSEA